MVIGILTFFPSILLLGFPRELPGAREMREKQIKKGNIRRASKTGKPTLKMILPELKDLLTNWTFLFNALAVTAIVLFFGSILPFYPKVLLLKFGVTSEKIGYVLGATLSPAMGGMKHRMCKARFWACSYGPTWPERDARWNHFDVLK